MNIEWKDIAGYEGKYQISTNGQVKALDFNHTGHEKLMKLSFGTKGYLQICLTKNNRRTTKKVHRLVAEAFIPNPNCLPAVNHIDENKHNNSVENLEWCTFEYNTRYGTRAERCGKPVVQLSMSGDVLNVFPTSKEAERNTGADHSHILNCCKGKAHCNSAGGFRWMFQK